MTPDEQDPFVALAVDEDADGFGIVEGEGAAPQPALPAAAAVVTARFDGFDLEERPLLTGVPGLPGEVVAARTTFALTRAQRGSTVVVVFEGGDRRRPIVLGVLLDAAPARSASAAVPVTVQADETRLVLSAEREIVLRCGDASITLTRAGKVLIKGTYVLSRSSGYNRLKGAAIDIN
jgi:hypothetical protein